MKLIGIILSFYFIGLTLIPCGDEVEQEAKVESVTENSTDHEGFVDICSPFCQCHCCHIHALNFETPEFETFDAPISTLIIEKGENTGEEIPDFHFQPPRLIQIRG